MKFEGFEKKIEQFVMVIFLSSAQSVYFSQYFCPSRLSAGIGVAKCHDPQISSISCHFAL